MSNYFCPDCGWEGTEAICAICQSPTENLDVDSETGKIKDSESSAIREELGDELDDENEININDN